MKYFINYKRGMLVMAAMILMTLFIAVSAVLLKITSSTKKTSVGVVEHLHLNDLALQAAKIIFNTLQSDAEINQYTSNNDGSGYNWVSYQNPSLSYGTKDPAASSIKVLKQQPFSSSFLTNGFLDVQKVATSVNSSGQIASLYSDGSNASVNNLPAAISLPTGTGGGYVVEVIQAKADPSDSTGKSAIFNLNVRPYNCDKIGSANNICQQNSNIATASLVITMSRSCPIDSGYQLIVPSNQAGNPYYLNCACPQKMEFMVL